MVEEPLIVIVYDGIANSVFVSQLLCPTIKKLQQNKLQRAIIVSFENETPSPDLMQSLPAHPRLQIKIEPRFRFWGLWTLRVAAWRLRSFLRKFDRYSLMARGPLAGYMCKQAYTSNCSQIIIQARGLAAEEYAYAHKKKIKTMLRTGQYKKIEKKTYGTNDSLITIEAVSVALKNYLITTYTTDPERITIARDDIPPAINIELKRLWRKQIRARLSIGLHQAVYCYNGSAKPWQCPQETISFFKKEYAKNSQAALLVLTQDSLQFERLLHESGLSPNCYRICTVSITEIYAYLSAADVGLLFREPHIINWVSRPTKLLEYQAVGLTIKHNNTIALLAS